MPENFGVSGFCRLLCAPHLPTSPSKAGSQSPTRLVLVPVVRVRRVRMLVLDRIVVVRVRVRLRPFVAAMRVLVVLVVRVQVLVIERLVLVTMPDRKSVV